MYGLCSGGQWRWAHHFLLAIWLSLLATTPPRAFGYFLGDTKAVLNGCKDHWTLQDRAAMPLLFQMTVCVDIRVVVPGAWVAFSYSSVHAPRPELGLEGDDGALYGWLLRVRHRFPLRLSPTHWHRVCLRRDVLGNSFSLEVDGKMVAERTVIAQAIPPSGSLWLGCRPRDRPPGVVLGEVEVYLFRIWPDLSNHGLCEDGTVIGWNAQFWGLTSPNARQRDPNLMCDHRRLKRSASGYGIKKAVSSGSPSPSTTSRPVIATPVTDTRNQTEFTVYSSQSEPPSVKPSTNVTSPTTTLSTLNPTTASSTDSTTAQGPATGEKTNSDPAPVSPVASHQTATTDAMSPTARSTPPSTASPSNQISTSTKTSLIKTLLDKQTTPRRSLTTGSSPVNCDISKLCSNENAYFWMTISVEAERGTKTERDVQNLVSKAFGCSSNKAQSGNSTLVAIVCNCYIHTSDCTSSQWCEYFVSVSSKTNCYVLLKLTNAVSACELQQAGISALQRAGVKEIKATIMGEVERVGLDLCGDMESSSGGFMRCMSSSSLDDICQEKQYSDLTWSECQEYSEISKHYKVAHLECHGTQDRLHSCMVILEMSGPVNGCSLSKLLQQLIDRTNDFENEGPLTRMVVCGPPGLSVHTLLASNLTWVASDLLTSDICQPDRTLLKWSINNGKLHNSTNSTGNPMVSAFTTSPNYTTEYNVTTASNNYTTEYNLTSAPNNNTTEYNVTTTYNNYTTEYNVSTVSNNYTTEYNVSTASNNYTTEYNMTTASNNYTTEYNVTTASNNYTTEYNMTTASNNYTTEYNMTTAPNNYTTEYNVTTASNNYKTEYNVTTASNNYTTEYNMTTAPNNYTAEYNMTTASNNYTTEYNMTTASNNYTTEYNVTTASNNYTTEHNMTTAPNNYTKEYNMTTASNNYTTEYNMTTASNNYTTEYNMTTASNNYTTEHNMTTAPNNYTTEYNVTTASNNYTTEYNVTTASNNYTKEYNVTTASNNYTTENNVTTASNNYTAGYNVTTASNNYTTGYNVTTASNNYTTGYNVTTASNNYTTEYNLTTAPNNYTTEYNVTTASNNYTTEYNLTTAPNNYTTEYNVTTASNNYTTEYNLTTAPNNYTTEYNVTTASNNYTKEYNVTTASNNYTTEYNMTTAPNNYTTEYNVTTASNNYTAEYNVTTASNNYTTEYNMTTAPNNYTTGYDVTTASNNNTTEYNLTTAPNNYTTEYNVTTASNNYTTEYNLTTAPNNYTTEYNMTTASNNHTTEYNVTTASNNYTKEYNVTTASNNYTTEYNMTTASNNYTTEYNMTTASNNYTTEYNMTTAPNNYTTEYNMTTASNNYTTEYNMTTASNNYTTEYNMTTASNNYTAEYNMTTAPNNYTTEYNMTTASNNYTTEYNMTTASNNYTTEYNMTTASNNYTTEYNVTTASNNYTTVENKTAAIGKLHNSTSTTTISTFTTSPNYTTVSNVTTAGDNMNLHNVTITSNTTNSTVTTSTNYTMMSNETTASNNYTTAENITTTSISQNNTTSDHVTTVPIRGTQQNTAVPYKNITVSTTARQVNETLYNATTSTKTSTVDNMTFTVDNTTKTTVTPLNNQTTHYTTVSVPHNSMTTNRKDTNSTTAARGFSPMSNLNTTAGTSFNLSSTASSLTINFTVTAKAPGVNLTTAANTLLEQTSTTSTSTTTTTVTTAHGPLPGQDNTTTAMVSLPSTTTTTTLQTTTLTSTTNTIAGTGITSRTTKETTTSQLAKEEQVDLLLNETQDASQLNSSQVVQVVWDLEKLVEGPAVSQKVGKKTINIVSNLMQVDSEVLSASANRLIRVVDNLGLKLALTGDRVILSSDSVVLAVQRVDGTNFPTISVNIFNTNNVQLRGLSRSQSRSSEPAMGSVFLPSSITEGLSPEEQQQANRVQFTFFTKSAFFKDAALKNETLVSPVLGASIANMSISNLKENIQFTIRNTNPIHANFMASCVFWDFTLNGGGGGWSSAGCSLVNATPEDTTCSCNHLTSFAILLDMSREGMTNRQQAQVLTFITYIGCGVSAIFLAVTILTYLSFQKLLRDIPAKILVQLCMSLFLLNLVFLLDGWLALYPATGLCISTAFFLHYFMLTSFTWAGLEALHMYLSIVQVFTPYLSRYMLKFSLMGWGIPLIVVIIVISVDKDNYGLVSYGKYRDGTTDDFCWLRNDIAFYVGVVAYFILIFVLCLLVFIIVMVQLARIKKQNPQNQSPNRGVMTDLRSIAGLILLLGLTWGFALFAWGPLYLPFVYLFSIFNSLQGFFIFVFHCAVKENVRRQWRTYLCCGKLRLAENSEWSRTATQNNRNMSVTTATTSALPLTSRSSSVISDGTNSSGSVFMDSGISDGSNSDVVLNELHRRNQSPQGEA
ncbi:adhesion G-protein coupled receptor G4 [Thunnus thynnus]|uniref:adhesion G-protein coupled receptor G4 n=1 Tax=Thunnus thynnus TaxID=8237 RepID=UPI00352886D4